MSFKLNIITPEKKVFEGDVESIKCPGLDGLFGVLSGHAPMVSALGDGTLSYESAGETKDVKISGGFLEVSNNVCSIMADSAE
ncbi:MAG: ATP synthase F1 subunit epsilon [Lentisphaeraceae bacterium]|nr:ATP synthase F1 subunit epsilon [Lentisphaeraceae bacterium]